MEIKLETEENNKIEEINQDLERLRESGGQNQDWEKDTDVEVFGNLDVKGVRFSDRALCEKIGFMNCKITGFSVLL